MCGRNFAINILSEERQGSLSLFQNEAPVIFFKGCARGAREGERTEESAAKALVFRFLRSLAVRRMILAKNASWELVCHLNALFVSQSKLKSFCITQTNTRAHDKRRRNCLNRARKKLFKEPSSNRFSISVFIFDKHCAAFLW